MRALTLILPHFANLGMLAEHQRIWASYPEHLRLALHVIVVDDCSPKGGRPGKKSFLPTGVGSVRLYRCLEKLRWNWLFARNLGVQEARTDWVLLTDIDHVLPAETLRRLVDGPLDQRNVYRLARVDAPHPWPYTLADCPIRPTKLYHPNTWLMTRGMYDRTGGYDERLSGCYGTDGEFRDRVQASAAAVVALPDKMVRYGREIIPDASTPPEVFTRKNDPANDEELRRRRVQRDHLKQWRPLRVTFKWEQIELDAHQEVA